MRAFYFANPGVRVDNGRREVGELHVDAGSYVVFAKANIGTNVAGGYPPPPSGFGGGLFELQFAGHHDDTYIAIKPESGDNQETAALMLAADTEGPNRVRLWFSNPYPLTVWVNSIRIVALQVDDLTSTGSEGEDDMPDDDAAAEQRISNLVRYGLADASATVSIAKLLHPDG